jgi:hypothetical protein
MLRLNNLVSYFPALVLPLFLSGCASSPWDQDIAMERRMERAAAVLEQRADADSLAAAGVLRAQKHPDIALSLFVRATTAAPERADLIWLQAQACQRQPPCDPEPVEARLRALDPSNGIGWMGALTRADSSHNDGAKDAALIAIGQAERVDIFWTVLIGRLSDAAARSNKIPLPSAIVAMTGTVSIMTIPSYSAASNACKGDRLNRSEVIEICRTVAAAFRRGDTYITEMIGIAIEKRVWPADSSQWQDAVEARRVYEYRSKVWADSSEDWTWDMRAAEKYIFLLAQHRREQDLFRAQLIEAGKNPDPPAD